MSLLRNIYESSPIFFQHIMASGAGYAKNRYRYGKQYYEHRKFLSDFDTWDLEKKLNYQKNELILFIKYAVNNSRYYKNLYKDIDIDSIRGIEDLNKLPIVGKEMLRDNINDIVTVSKKDAVEWRTGGTTGKSLLVYGTPEDTMKRMALLDNFKARIGFEHRKMTRATFSEAHVVPPNQKNKVFWRYNHACKQMVYSSFNITEKNARYYAESLNNFKPQSIDGYFISICDIAGHIKRHNIKLKFTPIAIFPTSETLSEHGRNLIEEVFKCKVYDQYASSEGAPFATECSRQVMHIDMSSGVFEHFEEGSKEILVTSFTTHGTPLIRYRIGDVMEFANDDNDNDHNHNHYNNDHNHDGHNHNNYICQCGMQSLIVKNVQGRTLDFLYTAEGAKHPGGNVANLIKVLTNAVIRAQFVQDVKDEINVFLEIDKNIYTPEHDNKLKKEFNEKFGPKTKIIIKHVEEIPREKNGKFRMIKNNVKADDIYHEAN